jgi:sugar/nucleoside kinase (ribokinase family)
VSCDLNYRKKLWSPAQAKAAMSELMPMVDYCIANEEDAQNVFGIRAEGAEVERGKIDHGRYSEVASALTRMFDLKGVAITLRESFSASRNGWSGMFYTDGQAHFSRRYEIDVVDRVGAGDAEEVAAGDRRVRRGRELPQALDLRRLQPGRPIRDRGPARRRRLGARPALSRRRAAPSQARDPDSTCASS